MRTICFDLDGTLTDPKVGIARSIQYALKRLGHTPPDADDLAWCIGPPLLGSFETLLGSRDEAKRALGLYRERFGEIGMYENRPYPGVAHMLTVLHDGGNRLFVATSKPTIYARKIIDHFGWSERFEDVHGSELDGTRSDKTDLLAWIVTHENLEPATVVMVGDRRHDIVGARNNGIRAIGVLYGYGSREELETAGAEELCDSPDDVLASLQRAD